MAPPLFESVRRELIGLGFEIGSIPELEEQFWDGAFDWVRTPKDAARILVPGVYVEQPSGIEFYMSFQPMRLAAELSKTVDGLEMKSVELDPDQLLWVYAYADGHRDTVRGDGGLQMWLKQLNARERALRNPTRFVAAKPKHEQTKIITVNEPHLAALKKLLRV